MLKNLHVISANHQTYSAAKNFNSMLKKRQKNNVSAKKLCLQRKNLNNVGAKIMPYKTLTSQPKRFFFFQPTTKIRTM